jgi:hypothetical protein
VQQEQPDPLEQLDPLEQQGHKAYKVWLVRMAPLVPQEQLGR